MSWLNDRMIQYLYRNSSGEEVIHEAPASDDPPKTISLTNYDRKSGKTVTKDAGEFQLVRMLPYKVNLTFKVQFERNGLVAYKYDTGNGKPRIVSATRENYEHNVGNTGGDRVKELKGRGHISRMAPSITTKGYRETFKKVQSKKGAR